MTTLTTPTTQRNPRAFFLILFAVALLLGSMSLTSCHKHTRITENGQDGVDGQDGQDGQDGLDGLDGLDGMNFFFVRGIGGNELVGSYWYGDASLVVPEQVLSIAPAEGKKSEGVILYLGTLDSPFRYYLIEDIAIVELSVLQALGLLEAILDKGELVEMEGSETIEVKRRYVRIGDLKIELSADHQHDDDDN